MRHLLAALTVLVATPALAGDHHTHHATQKVSVKLAKNKAVKEYVKANKTMHKGMDICYTGNTDIDFVEGMIPHHQGAIDAAKVQLRYGTDPEARAFAEKVIAAQQAEIVWMTTWLRTRGQ